MAPKSENCYWQLECSELKQRGAHLLQSGEWSDCSFLVGSEPQVAVLAHKFVLAMASPVFEAMFYGSMAADGNKPIPISDVQPEAFKALLEYIYTDSININSIEHACELCYGAKKYMLPHLVKGCIKYLWPLIKANNACQVYENARLLQENVLMEKCLQVICLNTKEVLKDSSFNDIDYDTMRAVFSQEHLDVDSELDLFEAAARHANSQINQSEAGKMENGDSSADCSPGPGDAAPSGPDERSENCEKPTIRGAIEQIRFLTLSAKQFAEGPAQSGLLTELEAYAVLMHLLNSEPKVPLPRGFSASRAPRKTVAEARPLISLSKSFINFIYQVSQTTESYFRCSCSSGCSSTDYAGHYFRYCPLVYNEWLDFMVMCRAFNVDPYSEDIKNHKDTMEALHIFLNQAKRKEY